MIINNDDLLPLQPAVPAAPELAEQLADVDDSISRLLEARAEAEEAEARAKQAGETKLPYLKKNTTEDIYTPPARPSFSNLGSADDSDSPAPVSAFSGIDLSRLSDATAITSAAQDSYASVLGDSDDAGDELGQISWLDSHDDIAGGLSEAAALPPLDDVHLTELLEQTVKCGASDLHLTSNLPPMVRKDGKLVGLPYKNADGKLIQRMVFDILNNEQIEKFERTHELDFSYGVTQVGRFRFNVYRQRDSVAAAMRVIPNKIPSMDDLKLPPILRELTRRHSGLILVTGPTGSGKSTTIASMIDIINIERECHILTIEDPIEYLHRHKRAMVNQRELGSDTDSFNNALRAALREDPDVILVGEMRDLETIAAAITLAETGHLVFATLHTRSAPATIDRIVDVFPSHQQEQIRMQLATSIEAVVAQQLLPKLGGGRVGAIEIMVATSALRNLIREGKTYQITSVIETGHQYGMQSMDRVLSDLYRAGTVAYDEAATRAIDRENFQRLVKGF